MTTTLASPYKAARKPYQNKQALREAARSVTHKRVNGLRLSWFVIGSLFGIGMSFFMNLFVAHIIVPEYDRLAKRQAQDQAVASASPVTGTPQLAALAELVEPDLPEYPRSATLTVSSGDTLMDMLVAESVDYDEAVDVISALRKTYNPRDLKAGQKIHIALDRHPELEGKAAVSELSIRLDKVESVDLERLPGGAFFVEKAKQKLESELTYAGGTITNSLFETGYETGVPSGVLAELVKAYSYDVDFQREIHRGDQMEVLFERIRNEQGETAGYGKIHYAMLKTRGKPLKIYRYEDASGIVSFYDANGESIVKALLKTPINGARMSSGYGMRRHPILGYSKMHQGTDFAAPTGTPIYAAGDGVVSFVGRKGGYGNYIKLRHNDIYSTAYAHASRFPKGMFNGKKVKQGDVIAYVGTTGRSTGPHLHYEVHKHGKQVNPMNEKFKTGNVLKGQQLAAFKAHVAKIENQIASMPKAGTKMAAVSQ